MTDNLPQLSDSNSAALAAAQHRAMRTVGHAHAVVPDERPLPVALIYLRVSTKEQARTGGGAEGYSIPAQRTACYAKADQLGAMVKQEYVDAGESARSADRDDLQQMLRDIKTIKPDYVIVHKIDRLARNREDDIAINLLLKKHGVKLVSCTENIDDTPSGRLLYGLMAEIAQFYSANLAQEVMKGLLRKAEEGGTPFRAPLGYFNRRETRGGATFSWVELDEERADIIRWCFETYATGDWSAIDLTLAAQAKGLTSRPTPTKPAQPISLTTMYHILQNPYYMGVVSYQGIHYVGKHPALIEPEVWLAAQNVLAAHNLAEKDRVHSHYLRSTIYCSECGGRLVFSRNKGRWGSAYDYFMCVKKKTKANNCRRPAVRVERIEDGIARLYGQLQVTPEHAAAIQTAVRQELASQQAEARRGLERATKRKTQTEHERQLLLRSHYAGAIPQDLLASEMQRLTRALIEVDAEIAAARSTRADIAAILAQALAAATHCERAYLTAPNPIRRQINQGFFEKLFIGEDGNVVRAELTEPFRTLLGVGRDTLTVSSSQAVPDAPSAPETDQTTATAQTAHPAVLHVIPDPTQKYTEAGKDVLAGQGLNESNLVELRGIEPLTFSMRTRRATNCATAPSYFRSRVRTGRTIAGPSGWFSRPLPQPAARR